MPWWRPSAGQLLDVRSGADEQGRLSAAMSALARSITAGGLTTTTVPRPEHTKAMPDVGWLRLIPTSAPGPTASAMAQDRHRPRTTGPGTRSRGRRGRGSETVATAPAGRDAPSPSGGPDPVVLLLDQLGLAQRIPSRVDQVLFHRRTVRLVEGLPDRLGPCLGRRRRLGAMVAAISCAPQIVWRDPPPTPVRSGRRCRR